jgi:hypothetical protein
MVILILPMLGKEQAPNNDSAEIFIEVHTFIVGGFAF